MDTLIIKVGVMVGEGIQLGGLVGNNSNVTCIMSSSYPPRSQNVHNLKKNKNGVRNISFLRINGCQWLPIHPHSPIHICILICFILVPV